jgi:hypothetical protein
MFHAIFPHGLEAKSGTSNGGLLRPVWVQSLALPPRSSAISSSLIPPVFINTSRVLALSSCKYSRTSISGREKNTREGPAYRIIPLKVARSACESSQKRTENVPLIDFLPLKAVPVIEVRL